jgi:TPP-dependent pyruvate/acetoin dehydrogenase alpha subunit
MSYGQEATAAGVCAALEDSDQLFASYRSHALYIGKTDDTEMFFAELYGKTTGTARGKSGSMHLALPEKGHYGSSAIVGSQIPLAVGAAYSNKMKKNKAVSCVFFGDGALDEGAFWESLNVSCVMQLPVLFICEDNDFAVHTPVTSRQGYKSIVDVARQFKCDVSSVENGEAEVIFEAASKAVGSMRSSPRPHFLLLKTYRYLEHVGIFEDFDAGYRDKKVFEKWLAQDAIKIQRQKLLDLGVNDVELKQIEKEIAADVQRSVDNAKKAPLPGPEELYRGVYGA